MYQALYRKWRPIVFGDVLGQEHITSTIKNQLIHNKLSHAYLFSGTRGTGKTSTAKILSRAVNCVNPINGDPCNECSACLSSLNGSAVDIVEIDAASNNKVDDVRIIRDEVIYTPAELKYKVYIIDEAHMLTNQAFNALLKTLEEPPSHIIFIFATTEPHKFPPTILSRCQRFDFKRITPYDTEKRIKQIIANDDYTITDDAISLLCRIADGSMRDALSILDQCLSSGNTVIDFMDIAKVTGASDPNFIYKFAQNLIDCNLSESFRAIKEAYEEGRDIERVLDDLIAHFRNVMIAKTMDNDSDGIEILMISSSLYKMYKNQANGMSVDRILRYIDILSDSLMSQKYSNNPRLCAEVCVTGIIKKPDISDANGIIERLMELENRIANGAIGEETPISTCSVLKDEPLLEQKHTKEPIPLVAEEAVPDNSIIPMTDEETSDCEPDYPIPELICEEVPAHTDNGSWDEIVEIASKKADFGFKNIISSAKVDMKENIIDISFDNESKVTISKMQKYDEKVKIAAKMVMNKDYMVRISSNIEELSTKQINNYDYLMNKLEDYGESINYL